MVVTIHMMDIEFFEFLDFSLRKIPVPNFLYRTPGTHLLLNNLNIFDLNYRVSNYNNHICQPPVAG